MAKTDKERLATGFWNRIESNQAADCNTVDVTRGNTVYGKEVMIDQTTFLQRMRVYTRAEMEAPILGVT